MVSAKPKNPTRVVEVSPEDLTEGDQILAIGERDLARPLKVGAGEIRTCPGQWRTHVHDPAGGCWDTRTTLTVRRPS